jgi:threonyl-tRNA synthetase
MNHFQSFSDSVEQRYLAAEVLALVVWHMFPKVILVGGGVNSLGFYYNFIFENPLTESMLEVIEVQMHRFIKENHSVRSISMMRENAQALFEHREHLLLAERAGEQSSNILELVQIEEFYDLCPPLSLTTTLEIGAIKLLEFCDCIHKTQKEELGITRLLGVCQTNTKNLKIFLKNYDSFLKKRDHRMLGPRLNLFSFSEPMGTLGVMWHPKGMQLQRILIDWVRQQLPEDELPIATPLAVRLEFLEENHQAPAGLNSFSFEGQEYRLRSSPLQQHLEFLRNFPPNQEDLPWRMSEYTPIFRQYPESQWWGLFCQCAYLIDHTTICCLREQVASELISSLHFIEQIITIFSFEAQWYLIASRQKSPKARQEQEAIGWLKQAIQTRPCSYPYSSELQEKDGEEVPCLELRVRDVLGREWPVSRLNVIQHLKECHPLLVQQAEEQKRVILTRQIWGSLDRFIALLIERYEGVFPLWLAPEQVRIIAIGETNRAYAQLVSRRLQQKGLRVKLDTRQAKLSMRVHEAEKENVPYLVLIGEQERIKQNICVRRAERFNQNQSVDIETFLNKLYQESLPPGICPDEGEDRDVNKRRN